MAKSASLAELNRALDAERTGAPAFAYFWRK